MSHESNLGRPVVVINPDTKEVSLVGRIINHDSGTLYEEGIAAIVVVANPELNKKLNVGIDNIRDPDMSQFIELQRLEKYLRETGNKPYGGLLDKYSVACL